MQERMRAPRVASHLHQKPRLWHRHPLSRPLILRLRHPRLCLSKWQFPRTLPLRHLPIYTPQRRCMRKASLPSHHGDDGQSPPSTTPAHVPPGQPDVPRRVLHALDRPLMPWFHPPQPQPWPYAHALPRPRHPGPTRSGCEPPLSDMPLTSSMSPNASRCPMTAPHTSRPTRHALDPSHTCAEAPQHGPHADDAPCTQTVPHDLPGPPGTHLALSAAPPTWFHVARPRTMRPMHPRPSPPLHQCSWPPDQARASPTCSSPSYDPTHAPRPPSTRPDALGCTLPLLYTLLPPQTLPARYPHATPPLDASQPPSTCSNVFRHVLRPLQRAPAVKPRPTAFPPFLDMPHPVPHAPTTFDTPPPILDASHPFPTYLRHATHIRALFYSAGTLMHEGVHLLKKWGYME